MEQFSNVFAKYEFSQLAGEVDNLCVFAGDKIQEDSSFIKTGARHSYAKYMLFPIALRRKFRTESYDFENMVCGSIEFTDKLYVIYAVEKKLIGSADRSP